MFVMDVPDVPPQYAPVMIAQASQSRQASAGTDRTIGVCHLIENPATPPGSAVNAMSPLQSVNIYFSRVEHRNVGIDGKVSVLQGPEHGELRVTPSGNYRYFPAPDYYGTDRATFLVEIGEFKIKAMYFFNVLHGVGGGDQDPYKDKKNCPKGEMWKISLNPDDPTAAQYTFNYPAQWTSALAATKVALNIADLSGGAVGQTTGNAIALDADAAGHGWFIDPTPADNAEFLPTRTITNDNGPGSNCELNP